MPLHAVLLEAPRDLRITERQEPAPGPGEALCRLRLAGICGSDLAAYRGTSPLVRYPVVLGHELLVDVLACPSRPELEGRRAVIEPLVPCGACRACRLGRPNCCAHLKVLGVHVDGGMQERFTVRAAALHAVPPSVPDELAVLAEPCTIAYHAVERADVQAGQVAVVFGAGTIGLLVAALLRKARGCEVISIDIDASRLKRARSLGALPLDARREDVARAVAEATGGELADVVFEATGSEACTRQTTDLVAHAGRIVLIGWNKGITPVDTVALMRKEVDLLGSRNSVHAFGPVLRLLAGGLLDADLFITHRFPLAHAGHALGLLDAGESGALKILVDARR